jgi:hypothetical protein
VTDLDRQIAELKGYEEGEYGVWLPVDPGLGWSEPHSLRWSTSDSKALELVDELAKVRADHLYSFGFHLGTNSGE